jgi:hypothetical protein
VRSLHVNPSHSMRHMPDPTDYPVPDAAAEMTWMDFMKEARRATGEGPETERLIDAMGGIRAPIDDDDVWVALLEGMTDTFKKMQPRS